VSGYRRSLAAAGICAVALLYASPLHPNVDAAGERARFYTTAALAENGTWEVDDLVRRWGGADHVACRGEDSVGPCDQVTGPMVATTAPGTSLLGVPAFLAYVHFATRDGDRAERTTALRIVRAFGTTLPFLIFLVLFHGFLTRAGVGTSIAEAAFLSVALGSLLYGYGMLFVGHAVAAAAAFGAFMLAHDARRGGGPAGVATGRQAFMAGLLATSVPLFETTGLAAGLILLAYAALSMPRRSVVWVLGGALIPVAILVHHQWTAYGGLFIPAAVVPKSFSLGASAMLLFDRGIGLFTLTPLLLFAIVGLPVLLRSPRQRLDGLVALTVVLATLVWVSAMDDWRGGWAIGPRHLAVALPFLGWAALSGLALVARRAPRMAEVLGLGATAIAIAAAGLPAVYFPHLPPELDRPLVQLFGVLTGHDFAPANVMNLFGVWGSPSMFPLFGLWAFAVGWAAWQGRIATIDRVGVIAGAAVVSGFMLGPLLSAQAPSPEVRGTVEFITRSWPTVGHDESASVARHLEGSGDATPEGYQHLASLYEEEGRDREAAVARRRGQLLSERNEILEARQNP